MANHLSALETQLIRSSLLTKTDEEIALILYRPVEEVSAKIIELYGGAREERLQIVQANKMAQIAKFRKPAAAKKVKNQDSELDRKIKKRAADQIAMERRRLAENKKREEKRTCKTKAVDWSTMRSVKVNNKIWIIIPKDANAREEIAKYEANRMIYERRHKQQEK